MMHFTLLTNFNNNSPTLTKKIQYLRYGKLCNNKVGIYTIEVHKLYTVNNGKTLAVRV